MIHYGMHVDFAIQCRLLKLSNPLFLAVVCAPRNQSPLLNKKPANPRLISGVHSTVENVLSGNLFFSSAPPSARLSGRTSGR